MPLYEWQCPCGKSKDEFRRVAERNRPQPCECGKRMARVITAYKVVGDVAPYYDDNLESWVKSKQDRKKLMRDRGVYESYGKGWR